ncbi:MAG: insulinase family protein [Spirochaetes bacterium]|nr:insulinase family protein [Spirochaetota bacterium]
MVYRYRQDNGLSVLLEPIEGVVSVSVGLWIKSGSRNETDDQHGYAHFIEHMLFKGTKNYSARDIARIVDRVGGQHNAATNREYTCYYINVVSDHIELAMQLLAETFYDSLFDSGELEKEKNVVMEEIRMYEDAPDELIHDMFMENMLKGHPLSHPILGTHESIRGTTREKLVGFFESQYRNDNVVLALAGNFSREEAERLTAKYFSRTNGTAAAPAPAPRSPSRVDYFHLEKDLEQVHFCLGTGGIRRDDDDRWGLYILSTVLGGSMSSRLFQNIREKEGISYSIYSFHSSYSDSGVFGIYCATLPENYKRAVELIGVECRDIATQGITAEELQDAKDFMKGNLALSLESVEVRMGQLAKDEITFRRSFGFGEVVDYINRVTMDDFMRISERIFGGRKLSVVSVGTLNDMKIPQSCIVF